MQIHALSSEPSQSSPTDTCEMAKIEAERLPDLHIPRAGHHTFLLNGEITVFGGHTSGYVLTPTAEYFSDGEWHQMQMVYSHDNGIAVTLDADNVLLAGGHEKNLGIGQSYEVEMYHPATHSFEGFGCLEQKRVMAKGALLDSGRIVISGNWYADDDIEMYDVKSRRFSHVKDVSTGRSFVHILRISGEDAIIFSTNDEKGKPQTEVIVDCLKGESFSAPILNEWAIESFPHHCTDGFIGDEAKGQYAYLMAGINDEGRLGIIEVRDTIFSLLPTSTPIPTKGLSGEIITYHPSVVVDRRSCRGYVFGTCQDHRVYILAIDYQKRPSPLTLYYTDPQDEICHKSGSNAILTADGNLFICGGIVDSNFTPLASAWLFHLSTDESLVPAKGKNLYWWSAAALLLTIFIGYVIYHRRSRSTAVSPNTESAPITAADITDSRITTADIIDNSKLPTTHEVREESHNSDLLTSICQLMEEQKLYLNSELKLTDISEHLCVHRNQVSDCINTQAGCTFAQFVANYRIEHAKRLLSEHSNKKLSAVWAESGFATERSFLRTFKNVTGMTPSEWRSQHT